MGCIEFYALAAGAGVLAGLSVVESAAAAATAGASPFFADLLLPFDFGLMSATTNSCKKKTSIITMIKIMAYLSVVNVEKCTQSKLDTI